jgi:two-component system nitrogen regulation response regulator GlnG
LPVIVISAQNNIMTAIQAAEADAYDYLPKPFDLPDLMKRAARALEVKPRAAAISQNDEHSDDLPLVGRTAAMQTLYRLVARVMNTPLSVLVTGESGTGKSLIARAIHDFSDRRSMPFVTATANDLDGMDGPQLLLSRVKGGSLVFDEVGDFSMETQSRIVRMMDALGDSAPRIIATSRTDLVIAMEEGRVREDLYYRLAGVTVVVPPLRDRVDDIPLLAQHFLSRSEREGAPVRRFASSAIDIVRAYTWPGNVRQLENVVRRLVVTSTHEDIHRPEVEQVLGSQPAIEPLQTGSSDKLSGSVAQHLKRYFDLHGGALPPIGLYQRILREVEAPLIEIALDATSGNQAKCAELLGINRNTLRKKITDLDIHVTRRRKLM